MSTYSMDHSTYYKSSSSSPEFRTGAMPESDLYSAGWTDAMFMSGPTPFSPVMSDTNQSAYTAATSDVSFPSLGPSATQEVSTTSYLPASWSTGAASNNFFAGPMVTESEMFPFREQALDTAQIPYHAWYTPTEATGETYFAMNSNGQSQNFGQTMIPQTAGFVVDTPTHMTPSTGYSNPNFRAGHVRVDSLYSQASPQDVAVSLNSVPVDGQIQDAALPHRMIVPMSSEEYARAVPAQTDKQDVSYGAPIQQYRTYAPGFPIGPNLPFSGSSEVPVLASNVSVSSASSVAPSRYEESPCSPVASSTTTRTRVEDTDGRARTDPLYSARARGDGHYHCPFVSEGCQHKPTKLKCNYDKYIDSHIKPFRCKHQNCNNNRFSSTACLLRHEREAHGLHGHGNKPFLCEFKDCDRSSRDNGFPRAYNLLDHMKRVHGYRPEKTAKTPPAQSAGRSSGKSQDKIKKRRSTGEATHQRSSSSVKKESMSPKLAQKIATGERKQQMTMQWQARVNELQMKLQRAQRPSDLQQVSQELAELQRMSQHLG